MEVNSILDLADISAQYPDLTVDGAQFLSTTLRGGACTQAYKSSAHPTTIVRSQMLLLRWKSSSSTQ